MKLNPMEEREVCGVGCAVAGGVWWLEGEFLWREIYLKKRFEEVR